MNILQLQELGSAGNEILTHLNEIRTIVDKNELYGYEYESKQERVEAVDETISMIQQQLTNLKSKQL